MNIMCYLFEELYEYFVLFPRISSFLVKHYSSTGHMTTNTGHEAKKGQRIKDGEPKCLSRPPFTSMPLIHFLLQLRPTRLTNNLTFVFGRISGISTKCTSRSIFLEDDFFSVDVNLNRILHLNPKNSTKFNRHDDATQLIKLSNDPSSFQVPNSPLVICVSAIYHHTCIYNCKYLKRRYQSPRAW